MWLNVDQTLLEKKTLHGNRMSWSPSVRTCSVSLTCDLFWSQAQKYLPYRYQIISIDQRWTHTCVWRATTVQQQRCGELLLDVCGAAESVSSLQELTKLSGISGRKECAYINTGCRGDFHLFGKECSPPSFNPLHSDDSCHSGVKGQCLKHPKSAVAPTWSGCVHFTVPV